jgi:hypothetical protein
MPIGTPSELTSGLKRGGSDGRREKTVVDDGDAVGGVVMDVSGDGKTGTG